MKVKGFPINHPPTWLRYLERRANGSLESGLTRPLWKTCDPCHNHWDAVIKMETFTRDSKAILRASGSKLEVTHENGHGTHGAKGVSKKQVWDLFRKSRKDVVRKFVDMYRLDFLICGYDDTLEELRKVIEYLPE